MKFLIVLAALVALSSAAPDGERPKRGIIGTTLISPGGAVLASPGIVTTSGLVGPSLVSPWLGRSVVLGNPGITAGTIIAPGTTLIGPNTNGAPGAVITNGLLGHQILI